MTLAADRTKGKQSVDIDIEKITAQGRWADYDNGNYHVWLNLDDGTKIRHTDDDEFRAAFPESMDIKITNVCDMGCPMCHEDSRPDGRHSDIGQKFLDTLHPYQEIAVGGGNVLSHPQLEEFLQLLTDKKCIPSITVNQHHFMENFDYVRSLYDRGLVYGIGVSLTDVHEEELVERLQSLPTAVLHTIVGLLTPDDVITLSSNKLKVLLLGYKDLRRGHDLLQRDGMSDMVRRNTAWLAMNLPKMMREFSVLSFDNLALEQLPVRAIIGEDVWQQFYMGDDGRHTFYIDMVEKEYARSSTSQNRRKINGKSIDEMFADIIAEKDAEDVAAEERDSAKL